MNLQMDVSAATGYASPSQIARRVTETWAIQSLYCLACDSGSLRPLANNSPAVDFACTTCKASYQLKAGKRFATRSVPDGAYETMIKAIRLGQTPNLAILGYSAWWTVDHLMVVPASVFTEEAVVRRQPLGPTARRAGWVGCTIRVDRFPEDAKLWVVRSGVASEPGVVRAGFASLRRFASVSPTLRGWVLAVWQIVVDNGMSEFSLSDVYAHEGRLAGLYPGNRNLREKIRQQLQVLRDAGFICFLGKGRYRITDTTEPRTQ